MPFPDELLLIKTSGKEELGAGGYTPRNGIILTHVEDRPEKDKYSLGLLAHELFHVLSRQSPEFRDALYALAGFFPCSSSPIPAAVEVTRITNPDAFSLGHCILLARNDAPEEPKSKGLPVLRIGSTLQEALAEKNWFRALEIHLLRTEDDKPDVWLAKDTDFQDRLSKNTHYSIHAEEMLADNFALWVRSLAKSAKDVSDPVFLERFSKTLRNFTPSTP
ncbi:MAG: hypothetical protein GY822_16895 [Deltaproteobacteria bacterium]|nr:hypothetical protein [Deltaproteobacteria bacterium]